MTGDQAQHLRRLAREAQATREGESHDGGAYSTPARGARTLAVTGGKGGVGKTNLSVALALCAARRGLRVALLDADFGPAKIHILLGLSPRADLRDVLSGKARLADTLITGPRDIQVMPGASGLAELAALSRTQRKMLLEQLGEVASRFDLLLLDTSAGIGESVLTFVAAADEALVVTTPEPTGLSDAYALIKVVAARRADIPFHLLVNNTTSDGDGDAAARRVTEVARRFLQASVAYAGSVPVDPAVGIAVRARRSFLTHAPDAPAAVAMGRIAERLLPRTCGDTGPREGAPAVPGRKDSTFVGRLAALSGLGGR